jgi:response regulator containing cheY-like receiver, AAA-type ATPase, and DNA-binding domains
MKQCHNGTEQLIVIDSNPKQNEYICKLIQRAGFPIKGLYSLKSARCLLANGNYVIITNSHLSDGECVDLLEWIHSNGKTYPVIIVTNRPEVHTAVTVMKLGATDYIPIQLAEDKLPQLIQDLQQEDKKRTLHSILQRTSEAFQKIHHRIRLVAPTELSVLIFGESGTGKENVARELHQFSKRADKPFVAVDCGSLSAALSYSAFFGHEKGAFTGADTAKTGFLQEANGGTLFLDEVGNLPVETQQMLLRAFQEKRYRPVGAKEDRIFNVRIIAATNENLNIAVIEKRFRQDLLYRLQDFTIIVPPLRDCQDDIMPLADFFSGAS